MTPLHPLLTGAVRALPTFYWGSSLNYAAIGN